MNGYSRGLGLVASKGSKETQSSGVWLKSEFVLGNISLASAVMATLHTE